MKSYYSDKTLYVRCIAKCSVVLGGPISLWAVYLFLNYPVDPTVAFMRIALGLGLVLGGVIVLAFTFQPTPRHVWKSNQRSFIGSRIDGLLFYLSFPVLLVALFFLPFTIHNYLQALSANDDYDSVKVRVESIEVRNVSKEQLPLEGFFPIFKEIYFIPDLYNDLWIAWGVVTVFEKNDQSVEPAKRKAVFTVPHVERYGGKNGKSYIEHYKMNAVMDSERFKVGQIYQGWILREKDADVFFTRSSDLALRSLMLIATLLIGLGVYLTVRVAMGMKMQDKHWMDLKEIWLHRTNS